MTAQDNAHSFNIQMQITIRQLQRDDLPKLEWYGQFSHFRKVFGRSYMGQLEGNRYLLVADMQGFPIGRVFIGRIGQNLMLSDGYERGYLYSLQVMSLFQGQGIGTSLITRAESYLMREGFRIATIGVSKKNLRALRLYQRLGYAIFDEDEGKWSYNDHLGIERKVFDPSFLLAKNLTLR
jgi:ribosomal protein S18 acetylase RimI-like enzyme